MASKGPMSSATKNVGTIPPLLVLQLIVLQRANAPKRAAEEVDDAESPKPAKRVKRPSTTGSSVDIILDENVISISIGSNNGSLQLQLNKKAT